jgi:small subunit ribosomal protein S8
MATSDPIADMLTRIRNANHNGRRQVHVKRSKVCLGIADVLRREGYIRDFASIDDANQGEIRIDLKYGDRGELVIQQLERSSRPSKRLYVKSDEIPMVLDGLGIAVLSTSRGVMSDRDARTQRVGGELLCKVW